MENFEPYTGITSNDMILIGGIVFTIGLGTILVIRYILNKRK